MKFYKVFFWEISKWFVNQSFCAYLPKSVVPFCSKCSKFSRQPSEHQHSLSVSHRTSKSAPLSGSINTQFSPVQSGSTIPVSACEQPVWQLCNPAMHKPSNWLAIHSNRPVWTNLHSSTVWVELRVVYKTFKGRPITNVSLVFTFSECCNE